MTNTTKIRILIGNIKMDMEIYVESLNKNEFGQFSDNRVKEIENDVENMMEIIFDKWNYIIPYDIETIVHKKIAHMAAIKTAKLNAK